MKILYVTPGCFDKGGISRYSRYQISALREIYSPDSLRAISLLGKTADSFEEDFNVHWSASGNGLLDKIRFTLRLLRETLFWKPDVIHVAHVNFSGLIHLLAKLVGAKAILNTYGLEVWSGLSWSADYGLRKIGNVVSDCFFTASYLEDEGIRRQNSTTVIWDCVDLETFYPKAPDSKVLRQYGIPDPKQFFVLMTLGRLSFAASHKGYERLLEVFAKVRSDHSRCRLVFAGKGDMRDHLEKRAAELGIGDDVVFAGMVDDAHLPDVYRSAHLFSLVSDRGYMRGEGIPLTPLEAMSCGTPILVGNHDGSQEAVEEGKNGYVLDPFDLEAHASAIGRLLENEDLRRRLALGARERSEGEFSYEDFRDKHRQLYADLMNKDIRS